MASVARRSDVPQRIEAYLSGLSSERASMMKAIRCVVLKNLPPGYVESFDGQMISYEIPLTRYPQTYNGRPLLVAALASQKSFVTLYLMAVYGDTELEQWFDDAYARSGRKLDMGKSCVHFKRPEDIPLDVLGEAIAKVSVDRYIEIYERGRSVARSHPRGKK